MAGLNPLALRKVSAVLVQAQAGPSLLPHRVSVCALGVRAACLAAVPMRRALNGACVLPQLHGPTPTPHCLTRMPTPQHLVKKSNISTLRKNCTEGSSVQLHFSCS